MLYDPQLEQRLSENQRIADQKLAPTLNRVTCESQKIVQEKDEYKNLLQELAKSDFVAEMKRLHTEIIE